MEDKGQKAKHIIRVTNRTSVYPHIVGNVLVCDSVSHSTLAFETEK